MIFIFNLVNLMKSGFFYSGWPTFVTFFSACSILVFFAGLSHPSVFTSQLSLLLKVTGTVRSFLCLSEMPYCNFTTYYVLK